MLGLQAKHWLAGMFPTVVRRLAGLSGQLNTGGQISSPRSWQLELCGEGLEDQSL